MKVEQTPRSGDVSKWAGIVRHVERWIRGAIEVWLTVNWEE
jgi:hypothetical protein